MIFFESDIDDSVLEVEKDGVKGWYFIFCGILLILEGGIWCEIK